MPEQGSPATAVPADRPAAPQRRIYVASSWRNAHQQSVVAALREAGHEVYDFHNPAPGNHGFHWSEIDPDWRGWNRAAYLKALEHPIAGRGFGFDYRAMQWADTGVLVLPSGRSAHIEAGYFNGAGKHLYILLLEPQEPELMYLMADGISDSVAALIETLGQPR